ncbi:DNA phosphorothioation-dependent restriction protein DptH [Salegentibacter sp. LM13S]|uniref:DNA phosphorothioation-dependent restriction protein DptH n=1 Tax=Salegentibacter lacus TaxID=2873599 RepID=UPI001CCB8448|nr:DNA phosphorothioation-dependent restriction protein DptH [Salegentibacter lacus]MBZ9631391.1 DNA phosphorothioation-dependent restriction protein DptH [Salegentibacter lacus]
MLNTSSQLYSYISKLIVENFSTQNISPGDRYNFYLEEEDHVKGIYEELRKINLPTQNFTYTHPESEGKPYSTFSITINTTKVIIASSQNATEDYFTTLRNLVALQKNQFENTALLILFSGKLDSLLGGSGSLNKEGMPLHHSVFRKKLAADIEKSSFKRHEKMLLNEVITRKTKSVVEDNNSIFDFSQVIDSLVKEKIESKDFKNLGFFPDEELKTKTDPNVIRSTLNENFELFERIENIHSHGDPEIDLEKLVSEAGRKRLIQANWAEYDFSDVQKWRDQKNNRVAPVFQGVNGNDAFRKIWCRSDSDTIAGRRNNNLIIFNPEKDIPYSIELRFDQPTSIEGVSIKKGKDRFKASTSGHSLKIDVHSFNPEELFGLINYQDKSTRKLYKFKILQLPVEEDLLKAFETKFLIGKEESLLIEETDELVFNENNKNKVIEKLKPDANYTLGKDVSLKIKIDYDTIPDDFIAFNIEYNEITIPLGIKPDVEPPRPITGLDVWKEKRENFKDFQYSYEESILKLTFKNNERTVRGEFRKNLLLEREIINSGAFSWNEHADNELKDRPINLPQDLKEAFNELRNYYIRNDSLPSLTLLNGEAYDLSKNLVDLYFSKLNSLRENKVLDPQERDLSQLGVVLEKFGEQLVKYSPLHPLNIAYQLHIINELKQEEIYNAVLERLSPMNLVPYLEKGGKVYTPIDTLDSPEWLYYTEYLHSEQSIPKNYVVKLVREKLEDFTYNFDFLFSQSSKSPIILNAINLGDCKEIMQGIFEYYRTFLNKKTSKRPTDLLPIDINIYGADQIVSKFEELTYYTNVEDVEEKLDVNLKTSNFEKEDLLNIFLEKINFYSKSIPSSDESYEYAHITFYQFDRNQIKRNSNHTSDIKSGISLNGLISDVPSVPVNAQTYRSGFGVKHSPEKSNLITQFSSLYNSLVNVVDNGNDFESNKAICTTIDLKIKDQLQNLYTNSQWVTYIDPKVDLDFFKQEDDLVIIHYSDQYNNSSGYDAITVTDKTHQYSSIVSEFLTKNKVTHEPKKDTLKVINFFNAINGDWLLKLIRQDNQFPREKISLLSGIKTSLSFLYHPDIIWIPISLEEILRVSGSAGLKMSDGLFSAKNLGSKEFSFSDDLLLIGLEKCNESLKMHLYPMELKIGGSNLKKKGIEQGRKTAILLKEHLSKKCFLGEFYKNFFAKLAITNAEKMQLYKIWDTQTWSQVFENYRSDLMNNNFEISNSIEESYGNFGLIHFGKETIQRQLQKKEDYIIAELLEEDGYNFLVKSIDELIHLFHETPTGIEKQNLLLQKLPVGTCEVKEIGTFNLEVQKKEVLYSIPLENKRLEAAEPEEIEKRGESEGLEPANDSDGIEILFGNDLKDGKKIIWEPNNTNKVMHTNTGIIGTMGTGKTQFTKSLIAQTAWNQNRNIGSKKLGILIFDYKGDYIKDDFVKATDAKVFHPYHLPYNPLALDVTSTSKPMLPLHTSNDIKETISNAFNLGNVQKQKLRDVIIEAYEHKGIYKAKRETWSKEAPTLGDVCNIYMSDEKVAHDSLYAAISNLQDFEIFEPDASKTKSLYSLVEGVTVINLSGYDESIQNLIVAITLDAFYTQMQTNGHSKIDGHKRQLRKMILVDEADNFLSKNFNSIRKILKEGREFGVGTVLSTQFLNHFSTAENDYSNYILTWVIHRVNEIKTKEVESLFTIESKDQRDNLIKTIKGLEKHHSIVNLAGSEPILMKDKAFWELNS